MLPTFEIHVMSCRNVYLSLKIGRFGTGANQSICCNILVILPVNMLLKELNLPRALFGKVICLKSECEHASDFTAQHQVNRIVEEQYYSLNMN